MQPSDKSSVIFPTQTEGHLFQRSLFVAFSFSLSVIWTESDSLSAPLHLALLCVGAISSIAPFCLSACLLLCQISSHLDHNQPRDDTLQPTVMDVWAASEEDTHKGLVWTQTGETCGPVHRLNACPTSRGQHQRFYHG